MASYPVSTFFNGLALVHLPAPGSSPVQPGAVFGMIRLPTDPVGTHVLTLTNVVVGSRVHIESQDGATVHYDALAAATTVTPTISVYSGGNPKNDWRIRIRKGSAVPYYQPYETLMTATAGSSSIFVSQVADE